MADHHCSATFRGVPSSKVVVSPTGRPSGPSIQYTPLATLRNITVTVDAGAGVRKTPCSEYVPKFAARAVAPQVRAGLRQACKSVNFAGPLLKQSQGAFSNELDERLVCGVRRIQSFGSGWGVAGG